MKFHRTLEKGQINAFKQYYIPYNELKQDIKNDKEMFKKRLLESLNRLNGFFIDLENEMIASKKKLLGEYLVEEKRGNESFDDVEEKEFYQSDDSNFDIVSDQSEIKDEVFRIENKNNEFLEINRNNFETDNDDKIIAITDENINFIFTDKENKFKENEKPYKHNEISNIKDVKDNSKDKLKDNAKEKYVNNESLNIKDNAKDSFRDNKSIYIKNGKENYNDNKNSFNKNVAKESIIKINKTNTEEKKNKKEIKSLDDNVLENKKGVQNFLNKNAKKFISFINIKKTYRERKKEIKIKNFIQDCEKIKELAKLNFTGYRKILKKYDKNYNESFLANYLPIVENSYFYKSKRIEKILYQAKSYYREKFADNDKKKAKDVFLNIVKKEKSDAFTSFFAGAFSSISIFIFSILKFDDVKLNNFFVSVNLFFYGAFLFGLCMLIFRKYYINYNFIFQFDAASKNISKYFFLVSFLAFVFNAGFYINATYKEIIPGCLLFTDVFLFIFPFDILCKTARFFFLFALFKIIATPKFEVQFRHFYIADCLLSFVYCYRNILLYFFDEISWKILFFVAIVPSYFRFIQCLRRFYDMPKKKIHLLNALKYSVSMFYISICFIESILFQEKFTKTRIYIYVISQIFNMYWDIKMDWGFPRKNIMYHWTLSLFIYISNVFLRLSLLMQLAYKDVDLEVYLAVGEITRRFLWTLLRVDHEHINNCDRLKALTMITLPHSDLFYRRDKENNDNGESEDLNKESSCFDETKIV